MSGSVSQSTVINSFGTRFSGVNPSVCAFAPGRLNFLGEHVDYMGGRVLPAAVDFGIWTVGAPAEETTTIKADSLDSELVLTEADMAKGYDDPLFKTEGGNPWKLYVVGVLKELQEAGIPFKPCNVVFGGNVPMGAGLSSSASLTVSLTHFFLELSGKQDSMTPRDKAKLTRRVEENALGARIGIMDQMASIFGKEAHFVELNCDTLEVTYHPINIEGYVWVLINSMAKHSVSDGQYNKIRANMETALKHVNEKEGTNKLLVETSLETLNKYQGDISEEAYNMAAYVIEETVRTGEFVKAMGDGDSTKVGELLLGTHDGLANKLCISTPEVEFIVNKMRSSPSAKGGRMMGAGFGGCVIGLVEAKARDSFIGEVQKEFAEKFSMTPEVYDAVISNGARAEKISL